jgi:hypothetical protein
MNLTRALPLSSLIFAFCYSGSAQTNAPPKIIAIRASHMLDVKAGSAISNAVVLIEEDKIRALLRVHKTISLEVDRPPG